MVDLAGMLAQIGLDPDAVAAIDNPLHPAGWIMTDPTAWQITNTEHNLDTCTPPGFTGATLADCPTDVGHWVTEHLNDPWQWPWLRLHGGTGRGKTHCAWAVVRAVVLHNAAHNQPTGWQFVTNADLNDQLRPKPDQSHAWALDRYVRTPLLVLDDLGAGNLTDFVIEGLLRVINYRFDQRLPTVYTSNLGMQGLARAFGDRVASRLRAATPVILDGTDRRHYEEN